MPGELFGGFPTLLLFPQHLRPGDNYLVFAAKSGATLRPGPHQRIGNANPGADLILSEGQRSWLVVRDPGRLDVVL